MIDQDAVIERLVAIVQIFEQNVLFDFGGFGAQCLQEALLLLVNVRDSCGQETTEAQSIAFAPFEGGSFVEKCCAWSVSVSLDRRQYCMCKQCTV